MSHASHQNLFTNAAKQYADESIRPVYPPELFEKIYSFCSPHREVALDVATGNGQSAQALARQFKQVYAIDHSEGQIKQAKALPNIQYDIAPAEHTGRPAHSVDLITVAAALHWFDLPLFYKEARRVLKPDGTLAAWCYKCPKVKGNEAATNVLDFFFRETLKPYLLDAHHIFLREYRGHEPTIADFETVEWDSLDFERPSSVQKLLQFVDTTGVYANMKKASPQKAEAVLQKLKGELLTAVGSKDEETPLTSLWETFIIFARNPKPS